LKSAPIGEVGFVSRGSEIDLPYTVDERGSGRMKLAGFGVLVRLRMTESSLVGAEKEESVVLGGLIVSELENEDIAECNVEGVVQVEAEEIDVAKARV
jgi:hypothetical protein